MGSALKDVNVIAVNNRKAAPLQSPTRCRDAGSMFVQDRETGWRNVKLDGILYITQSETILYL